MDLPLSRWGHLEKRLHIGHYKLLELFQKFNVKATYFILGKTIEDYPNLIQEIINEGHEIGCHTYSHPFIFKLTPDAFRLEIQKCKQLISQFGINYTGFRAPYFSIDVRNLWALDILHEEGFGYDSSLFAGDAKRTGIPGYDPNIKEFRNGLFEFPVNTIRLLNLDFGAGGGYFRLLPYGYFKKKFSQITAQRPGIFYIHPWEFDVDQPKISGMSKRIQFTHYINLKTTHKKVTQFLTDFECTSVSNILNDFKNDRYKKL
jgi:hypothetical protein